MIPNYLDKIITLCYHNVILKIKGRYEMTNELTEAEVRQVKKVAFMLRDLEKEWEKLSEGAQYVLSGKVVRDYTDETEATLFFIGASYFRLLNYVDGQLTCELCFNGFTPNHKGKPQRWCSKCSRNARQREWRARRKAEGIATTGNGV